VFWVISVYFNIRNTLPKSGTFLLGHPVYIYIYLFIYIYVYICIYTHTQNLLQKENRLQSNNQDSSSKLPNYISVNVVD
jgi:hypothetical protein